MAVGGGGRAGQAVRRDAARGEGDDRPAPDPGRDDRDTQVRELLNPVDLDNAVVTGDSAHAQHETAACIAGRKEDGNRGPDYFPIAKGQPALAAPRHLRRDPARRPARARPRRTGLRPRPDHRALHLGHRRRRPGLPRTPPRPHGSAATATTSPAPRSARRSCTPSPAWTRNAPGPRTWPASPAASGASSRCTGCDTVWAEDRNTAYAGNGPQVIATLKNLAVSLLHLADVTEIKPASSGASGQRVARSRARRFSSAPRLTCGVNGSGRGPAAADTASGMRRILRSRRYCPPSRSRP